MTESPSDAAAPPSADQRSGQDAKDHALASSTPDLNHLFLRMLHLLKERGGWMVTPTIGMLITSWQLFSLGLPALVGASVLLDKLAEWKTAEHAQDIEMRRIELAEQARPDDAALASISTSLDSISDKLDGVRGDITALQAQQQVSSRSIGALQRRAKALETREREQ